MLKNIELEIQENNKIFNKFDIKFKFYTTNQSSKDIENNFFQYKYINKFCNLEIKTFDNLSKNFDKKNKYKLLGSLQTLSFIDNILYDYMFFLYPDFLFKLGSINNLLNNLKNYDIFYSYCPQVIEEDVLNKIKKIVLIIF